MNSVLLNQIFGGFISSLLSLLISAVGGTLSAVVSALTSVGLSAALLLSPFSSSLTWLDLAGAGAAAFLVAQMITSVWFAGHSRFAGAWQFGLYGEKLSLARQVIVKRF
jgi:hypothetical protein